LLKFSAISYPGLIWNKGHKCLCYGHCGCCLWHVQSESAAG